MAQLTVKEALRRCRAAWAKKDNWTSTLGDAMRIVHPHRDGFHSYAPGQKKEGAGKVWDATAGQAAIRGANQMMGLHPAFEDWIVLEPGPAAEFGLPPDQLHNLRIELQGLAKQCNALVQMGDFASAAQEMWIDWLYSTGAMTIDGSTDPFGPLAIFRSVPLSEFMIEEGPNGSVDTWHRRFKIPGRSIKLSWPDAEIPEGLARRIANRPEEEVELFEITYRDYDEDKGRYRYEVFAKKGAEEARLVERQERTSRWLTPRNTKVAGEVLGRGQLLTAMPDIRTLNTIVEIAMRAATMQLLGIYTSDDDAINENTIRLRPGTIIKVRRNGGPQGPSLARLDSPDVRMDFAQALVEQLRSSIKAGLFDDGLPPQAGAVRSATEIVQRMRQQAVDLGGVYGRIVSEFVQPLVQRLVDILGRRGVIKTNFDIDQFVIRVRVSSQVARAQAFAEVEQIVQWLEIIIGTGGKEALLVTVMAEEIYGHIANALGVPQKLVRAPAEQKKMLGKLQAMAQQQIESQPANETIPPRQAQGDLAA